MLYLAYPHFKWLHWVITLVLLRQIIKPVGFPCTMEKCASLSTGSSARMVQKEIFVYFILIKEIKKKMSGGEKNIVVSLVVCTFHFIRDN